MKNPAEDFFGGLLVEIFLACMYVFVPPECHSLLDCSPFSLYGMTVLQTFIYFQRYRNDLPLVKTLVRSPMIQSCKPTLTSTWSP